MDINLSKGRIHAQLRGTGKPLIDLHGGGLDHRHMLDALEPVFVDAGEWSRIYIDLPGQGRSYADASVKSQDDMSCIC